MRKFLRDLIKGKTEAVAVTTNEKITIPFKFEDSVNKVSIPFIDNLSDADLMELNNLLDWNAFILDAQGRRFGNIAWSGKRDKPEIIPDPRHALLSERINLTTKHVLEIGCFEGIHTISLCRLAAKVTAVDSRIENVVKTIVRTAMFNYHPTVFKCDVENWESQFPLLQADVCHHIGVLYHLKDPVKHLQDLGKITKEAILLDTHYAHPEEATEQYEVGGKNYAYKKYGEGKDVFSGMYDHAKWLPLNSILEILNNQGFKHQEVLEKRDERNGPRVLLYLARNK